MKWKAKKMIDTESALIIFLIGVLFGVIVTVSSTIVIDWRSRK
jgi:uncharacterized membrane protein (DUF106 family)